jgi:hypothetical protein
VFSITCHSTQRSLSPPLPLHPTFESSVIGKRVMNTFTGGGGAGFRFMAGVKPDRSIQGWVKALSPFSKNNLSVK